MTAMEIKELPGAPIFGHLLDFRSRRLELLRRVAEDCGDLGMIRLGPLRALIVSNARTARDILTERHDEFCRVPMRGMDGIKALFGDGMVVADGEKHRAQRKRVMSVFSRQRINANAAVIASEVEAWQGSLADGQELDLADEVDRLTRRIARRTLFGITGTTMDEALENALTKSARLAMAELARLLPLPGWIPTPHNVEFRRVVRALDERIMGLVRQRRERGGEGDDALSVLVSEADRGLEDRDVRDDLMSLFVAGNEATTSALFWCVYHLTQDPKLADQLRSETRSLATGSAWTAEEVARIPLATNIFRESMRLYPAAHIILRRTAKNLDLGNARVPRDLLVMINGFMIHRDPAFYEAPDEFRPARFRGIAGKEPTVAYLPFGAGPRTCVGNHFAMLQGPLSLMIINREVRFEPITADEVQLSTGFAIAPKGGYKVRVRRIRAT
jgi:cytochrome P450